MKGDQESFAKSKMNLREFLRQSLTGTLVFGAFFGLLGSIKDRRPLSHLHEWSRRGLIRPTGALNEKNFLAACIRCQVCREACDRGAIKLFGTGSGAHEGTPYMVPDATACNLCLKCGHACPTGAITPLRHMSEARMGTAVVDEKKCVSYNGGGICGACFTICPLKGKAITQGMLNRPTVRAESCVGCGLCEEICITDVPSIAVVSRRYRS